MYSSQRAQAIVKKDVTHLAAGIHEDVKLVSVKLDTSVQGNKFLEFKFEKEGKPLTHTEWEPTKRAEETDEAFQDKCDNQFSRIEQILKCFYPNQEDRQFVGENFTQFAQWVCDLLNKANLDILLRIKVVYNDRGYTTLPKYAKYTFIEPMTIPSDKSVIVKLGIDNFEKPVIADNEKPNPNPLDSAESLMNSSDPNGLPF
jgi:hypothetical protein